MPTPIITGYDTTLWVPLLGGVWFSPRYNPAGGHGGEGAGVLGACDLGYWQFQLADIDPATGLPYRQIPPDVWASFDTVKASVPRFVSIDAQRYPVRVVRLVQQQIITHGTHDDIAGMAFRFRASGSPFEPKQIGEDQSSRLYGDRSMLTVDVPVGDDGRIEMKWTRASSSMYRGDYPIGSAVGGHPFVNGFGVGY